LDNFYLFCVSLIWSSAIWPIDCLKNCLWHSKTSKSHITASFYDLIKISSPKIRHQNDVTKNFQFQAPPLAKPWLRSWLKLRLSWPCSFNFPWKG